jgi:hypothetical protein
MEVLIFGAARICEARTGDTGHSIGSGTGSLSESGAERDPVVFLPQGRRPVLPPQEAKTASRGPR